MNREKLISSDKPESFPGPLKGQVGMALVLVMWVVTLLAVIAASFSLGIRREAGTVRNLVEEVEARAAAEAGIRLAMLGLTAADREQAWLPDGSRRQLEYGRARLSIRITDEAGRVDINMASPELIEGILRMAGVEDPAVRASLRDTWLDWRDPSPFHRPAAVTKDAYRLTGLEYGPRNGPFLATEELLLLPGMNMETYRRLIPWVTVHSRQSGINPASADRDVLLALPGMNEEILADYLFRREQARIQGLPIPGLSWPETDVGGSVGEIYGVESVATLPSGLTQGVRVVMVQNTEAGLEPYRIIHFRLETLP